MTRTTVYTGTPHDEDNETVYDAFHNHDNHRPVVIKTSGGQEIHLPEEEGIDIYIDGDPVDEEE